MPHKINAPNNIRIVWTKSVQMTADSPPTTVNTLAMANKIKIAM